MRRHGRISAFSSIRNEEWRTRRPRSRSSGRLLHLAWSCRLQLFFQPSLPRRFFLLSWLVAGPGKQAARPRSAQIGAAQLGRWAPDIQASIVIGEVSGSETAWQSNTSLTKLLFRPGRGALRPGTCRIGPPRLAPPASDDHSTRERVRLRR